MVTIQDVANEAGVSKATVSYVLANSPLISSKTAEKVRQAMNKLGYSVNHAARVLSTKQTKTIGIVAPDHRGERFSLSFGAYLYSLGHAASNRGYDSLMLIGDNDTELVDTAIRENKVDGIILMDVKNNDPRIQALRNTHFPSVLLGDPATNDDLNIVDTNYESLAESAITHIAQNGHKEILFINWPQEMTDANLNFVTRFASTAQHVAAEKHIHMHTINAHTSTFGSFEDIRNALTTYPQTTCILVHNDSAVISLPQVLEQLGIAVPHDLSVLCIVPDQMGVGMRIPYSSYEIDIDKVANSVLDLLIQTISAPEQTSSKLLIRHPLVENGSVLSI